MRTIVLPGFGNPVTMTPLTDSTVGVLVNGSIVKLNLPGNVTTRIEFLGSRRGSTVASAA